jgi:hypothetical protein
MAKLIGRCAAPNFFLSERIELGAQKKITLTLVLSRKRAREIARRQHREAT